MRAATILLVPGFCALLVSLVWADKIPKAAEQTIRAATHDIYAALEVQNKEGRTGEALTQLVNEILVPHADLKQMSRWVLGNSWRAANAVQRIRFEDEFRTLLIRTYATAIVDFSPQQIEYLPARPERKPGRAIVRTLIHPSGEPVVAIDYYMHQKNSEWLVYDVRIEGVSMVASYRTTFAAEIHNRGMDGLLNQLSRKNQLARTSRSGTR